MATAMPDMQAPAVSPAVRTPGGATILLPLLGLACIGVGLIASNLAGEFDRMGEFLATTPVRFFSAVKGVMYPSVQVYLGMVFAGPAGGLMTGSLVLCTCLGVTALYVGRRQQPGALDRALALAAALLLPLLAIDFILISAIEFTSAQALPYIFDDQYPKMAAWVPAAAGSAAVLCLTADWLILRWAWRRGLSLAGTGTKPAAA